MKKNKKNQVYSTEYLVHLGAIGEPISYIIGTLQSESDAIKYKEYIEKLIHFMKQKDLDVVIEEIKVFPLIKRRSKRIKRRK